MQRTKVLLALAAVILFFDANFTFADNGAYGGSGGSFSFGSAVGSTINASGVPLAGTTASYSFSCPITFYGAGTYQINWTCAGGSMSISSTDNSISMQGTFTSGKMTLTASGGGRGGNTHYYYTFSASFSGTITKGAATEAVIGSIVQSKTGTSQGGGAVTSATLGWNSAYAPVLVGDSTNGRLLMADNITGANLATYGTFGAGTGNFETIGGLAQDATGRIYVTDSTLNRLVRIDNISGANWTTFGTSGSGTGQFMQPRGVTIDSAGKIWVADAGNNRIVRMDDISGTNWTTFGTLGSGTNQLSGPSSIAFDATNRIYVADAGNNRIVRFDDLSGTNWVTFSQLNIDPYGYPLADSPGIAVDATGRIYIETSGGFLVSMTDMTGSNGQVSSWGSAFTGLSLDKAGEIYVSGSFSPGVAQAANAAAAGYFASSMGQGSLQPSAILAMAVSSPPPADPVLAGGPLSFGNQNVNEASAAQLVMLTNIGGAPLPLLSITASPDFKVAPGCANPLPAGSSCNTSVRFDPTVTGPRSANLTVASTSGHPVLQTGLSGTGTAPTATVLPTSLTFDPQQQGTTSSAQLVTLSNNGTGPLTISSIMASSGYVQGSNCPGVLASGSACTIQVAFNPGATGTIYGNVTIADDATPPSSKQTIALQGLGMATAAPYSITPESLFFPNQLVGSASPTQVVTMKNSTGGTVSLGTPSVPAGFKILASTCGTTVANGASCTATIQFVPTAVGPTSGSLTVPVTGKGSVSVMLSGTGVAAGSATSLSVVPAVVNFGLISVGDNTDQNITITNTTGVPTGINSIKLTGDGAITVTDNNCKTWMAANASCVVQVTLTGSVAGFYQGTLTIVESTGVVTQVPISGSAQ